VIPFGVLVILAMTVVVAVSSKRGVRTPSVLALTAGLASAFTGRPIGFAALFSRQGMNGMEVRCSLPQRDCGRLSRSSLLNGEGKGTFGLYPFGKNYDKVGSFQKKVNG